MTDTIPAPATPARPTPAQPLAGIRILDFCWIGAGALVTKTLAELGASIYRVESRRHPDNLRLAPPFRPGAEGIEGSGYFASRNPSKQSVAIDMKTEEGRALAFRMASTVDVVTSNFRPGIMERWGFSYDAIREVNPSVIYLTMPMQGAEGPDSTYIGFGSTIAALSGLVALSGQPGRTPVGTGTHYPDHVPNPGHALVALLAALRHRSRTGEGQSIELAQFESTINVIGPAIVQASAGGTPEMVGNRVPDAAPHGAYECSGGSWVVIECLDDAQWLALCAALDREDLAGDSRFATLEGRKANEDELDAEIAATVAGILRDDVLADLRDAGVPSAPVNSSRDIVEDPVLWERGFWEEIDHPVIGPMPISRTPFRRVGSPRAALTRPPLLGEHTWDVLSAELGMTREEYDALVESEVLY